jgi:drug/metabolite transporter (DMT)-like permease
LKTFLPFNKNMPSIGLMIIAMLLFQGMDALVKWLVENDVSAIQIIAVRSWIMLPAIFLVLLVSGKLSLLKTEKPLLHSIRGILTFLAPYFYFTALKSIPIADAAVIFFAATFILTAGAANFFKEKVGIHRWSAVVIGFVGVIIAMNPQGGGDVWFYLMVLLSTTIYAISFLVGKHLSTSDSIIGLVFWLQVGMGGTATLLLPSVWVPLNTELWIQIIEMTAVALIAHYCITASFSKGDVSVIAPFEYTALIWAVLLGYLFWGDIPGTRVWIGAAIIIASGIYVIHRESLRHSSEIAE